MNCQMTQITVTYRDGRMVALENVYIRGSKIRFLILPDMLKNAPMFKNKSGSKSGTAGRGKSAILRAQAARGRGRGGPPGAKGPGGPPGGSKAPWQGKNQEKSEENRKLTTSLFSGGPQGGRGRGGI